MEFQLERRHTSQSCLHGEKEEVLSCMTRSIVDSLTDFRDIRTVLAIVHSREEVHVYC